MAYKVTLMPSGRSFDVAEGQRILTAAMHSGVSLPYSCRQGTCQSCLGRIVEGSVNTPAGLMPVDSASGYTLLCQAVPVSDVVVEVKEVPPTSEPRTGKIKVRVMRKVAPDVMILEMKLPITTPIKFIAGQYIDLLLPNGKRRSYSMANSPIPEGDGDLELHVRLTPGGYFTSHVFNSMMEREVLGFEGPLGTFFLRDSDKPIIMVASGTGYAPIRSMIEGSFKRDSQRSITLYWGCRNKRDLYLLDEPLAWSKQYDSFRFVPVLSEPSADDRWSGRTGFVHRAVSKDYPDLSSHQVYACGAPVMVDAARKDFTTNCNLPHNDFFADAYLTEADFARVETPK